MISARMAIADLRDSWSAWVAVSLTFVVTSAALGLSALVRNSATAAPGMDSDLRSLLRAEGITNILFCSFVALAVVSSSTSLVVASRRGAIARLLLAGATPGQVVRMLLLQLAIVTIACSVIGNAVAVAAQAPVLRIIAEDRGYDASAPALLSLPVLLAISVYCVIVAMLGGLREARRATAIPPVEALRASNGVAVIQKTRTVLTLGWVGFAICSAVIVAAVLVFQAFAADLGPDAFQTLGQIAMASLVAFGFALSLVVPAVVGPLTRLWTRLIPLPGPTWHLARHMVVARADRLTKSVVPVMFAVGLIFGMMTIVDSINATLRASGAGYQLDGSSTISLLSFMGLSIAISLAGSVGNLMMMARQRDAELALDSVVGATPRQQLVLPALEATIVTGTAALLGLAMAGVSFGVLAFGLPYAMTTSAVSMPLGIFLGILLMSWLIALASTVLPSLPSLRRPAPRVIARLVAS